MRRVVLIVLLLGATGAGVGLTWWLTHRTADARELVLYGNVDLRQVQLAFNNNERIAAVLVQEGDRVRKGQVVARLDTSRLEPQVAQAAAQVAAQRHVVERLHNGSRPEEIEQARANVELASADAVNARRQYERLLGLSKESPGQPSASRMSTMPRLPLPWPRPSSWSIRRRSNSPLPVRARKTSPRPRRSCRAIRPSWLSCNSNWPTPSCVAPMDAVVRTRLMEPGEMASPQKPVFSLAIIDPKWVRAYVSEPDLGKVHPGMAADVTVDSFPNRRFDGWIGFISPVAEFTPKTVQTEELRTSLVYEVRVFVEDPAGRIAPRHAGHGLICRWTRAACTTSEAQAMSNPPENAPVLLWPRHPQDLPPRDRRGRRSARRRLHRGRTTARSLPWSDPTAPARRR